jgi:predicted NBD/HSP70 family sugar kinase
MTRGTATMNGVPWHAVSSLRAYHRALVLRALDEHGSMSRAGIGEVTGLSLATVGSIVADLCAQGRIVEVDELPPVVRRGRRPGRLVLVPDATETVGVYIGVGRIGVARCRLARSASCSWSVPFSPSSAPEEVLDQAIAVAEPLVAAAGPKLVGIGVTVPGAVDTDRRVLLRSVPLAWQDVAVAERFESALGVPTVVEYNVRAMAMAEYRWGFWRRPYSLLYFHIGVGVGFAFLIGGSPILDGAAGVSGFGHHRVAETGPRCGCGVRGCLESLVSTARLRAQVVAAAEHSAVLAGAVRCGYVPLHALVAARQAGDRVAASVLAAFVDHVTSGLAAAVNTLSATRVSLGGLLATAPAVVREEIRRDLDPKICGFLRGDLRVEASPIRPHPGAFGAGTVALDRLFLSARVI